MKTKVFLGLGANLGDPLITLRKALTLLRQMPRTKLIKSSNFYLTSPVSPLEQSAFVNAVCLVKTSLSLEDLFFHTQKIEHALGKKKKKKIEPRMIDIDLLFFGTKTYQSSHLTIPHPRWKERLFVLVPLEQLQSQLLLPEKKSFSLKKYIKNFSPLSQERLLKLEEI